MVVERSSLGYAPTSIQSQISESICLGRQEAHLQQISLWGLTSQCILSELAPRAAVAFGSCRLQRGENAVCPPYMPSSIACSVAASKEGSSMNWDGVPELSALKPQCALFQNVCPWQADCFHQDGLPYPDEGIGMLEIPVIISYLLEEISKPFWPVKPPGKKVKYNRLASPR